MANWNYASENTASWSSPTISDPDVDIPAGTITGLLGPHTYTDAIVVPGTTWSYPNEN